MGIFRSRFVWTPLLALAACQGAVTNPARVAEQLTAMREGCVSESLDALRGIADAVGPLATTTTLASLESVAQQTGCDFTPGATAADPSLLTCAAVPTRVGAVSLSIQLRFYAGDVPLAGPEGADRWTCTALVDGALSGDAAFDFQSADGEITIDGTLSVTTPDGCVVETALHDVVGRTVADLPNAVLGISFISGDVGVTVAPVDPPDAPPLATGSIALSGRNALVALQSGGSSSLGEVSLSVS